MKTVVVIILMMLLCLPGFAQMQVEGKQVTELTNTWEWTQSTPYPTEYRIYKRNLSNGVLGNWDLVDTIAYVAGVANQSWTYTSPGAETYQIYVQAYDSATGLTRASVPSNLLQVNPAQRPGQPGKPVSITVGVTISFTITVGDPTQRSNPPSP